MANRLPFYKMFPADFDRDLRPYPLEIRGAWITIINDLWVGKTRGRAIRTISEWALILGVVETDAERILLYIKNKKIGNITFRNKNVTVVSRRQQREEKERQGTKQRVKRWRNAKRNAINNASVTGDISEVRSQKSEVILQKDLDTIAKKPSTDVDNPVDKFVVQDPAIADLIKIMPVGNHYCRIKYQDENYVADLLETVRQIQKRDKLMPTTVAKIRLILAAYCETIGTRYFYEGCDSSTETACLNCLAATVQRVADQVDKGKKIDNLPAYLKASVIKEIDKYGEDHFKPAQVARRER